MAGSRRLAAPPPAEAAPMPATLAPAPAVPGSSVAPGSVRPTPADPAAAPDERRPIAPLTGPALARRYAAVRAFTEDLVAPLSPEDCVVQPMPDASPAKWHLAHTAWFFEAFLLKPYKAKYRPFDAKFGFLFNSYYDAFGDRHERADRGLLTRPSLAEVMDYRAHVDAHMANFLDTLDSPETARLVEVGLHHEQQHQELLLTDIQYTLWRNPLRPAYREPGMSNDGMSNDETAGDETGTGERRVSTFDIRHSTFTRIPAGLYAVGHPGGSFCYDNEQPRHRVYLHEYSLADAPVTCGAWREFIDDGGYQTPSLWLAAGWAAVRANKWKAPLYWERAGAGEPWRRFSLSGMRDVIDGEPVCHVSLFEADAFARWAGARLPTEQEWEVAAEAAGAPLDSANACAGAFAESGEFCSASPGGAPPTGDGGPGVTSQLSGMMGGVWEWTASQYTGYPGYAPPAGALGEYNGKFMCDQWALRGGSRATPASHARRTYRNFFPATARWQFSGVRLARS